MSRETEHVSSSVISVRTFISSGLRSFRQNFLEWFSLDNSTSSLAVSPKWGTLWHDGRFFLVETTEHCRMAGSVASEMGLASVFHCSKFFFQGLGLHHVLVCFFGWELCAPAWKWILSWLTWFCSHLKNNDFTLANFCDFHFVGRCVNYCQKMCFRFLTKHDEAWSVWVRPFNTCAQFMFRSENVVPSSRNMANNAPSTTCW